MECRNETTFFGHPVTLRGHKIAVGEKAPDFTCLDKELKEVRLTNFKDKTVLISVVPSIDTKVCQLQTKQFNEEANALKDVVVLTISCDLPFAQDRFCAAEGLDHVLLLSDHKDLSFGESYGFVIEEFRLLNRGIVLIDKEGIIRYVEYVKENTDHPDYDEALRQTKKFSK